ncbi:hypothetical protein [Curtobacterium sp. TC1]|uniref:hypothetical protein n=1 Tax=Curtobacterium sp. TC1 TaxID=2862880 RepID=UPI0021C0D5F3|nr:hypothetical protein [Curtobacterium sp. TC1]
MSVIGTALRRERVRIPVWALVAALLAGATAAAVPQAYGTLTERRSLVEVITASPSLLALRGVPDGTGEGAYAFFEVFTCLGLTGATSAQRCCRSGLAERPGDCTRRSAWRSVSTAAQSRRGRSGVR